MLAPNSLKFLAQVGKRTQASRERLDLTRIKHRAQPTLVILMAVYPAQKQGSQPGLEPTTSRLLYRGSSPFTHCATSAGKYDGKQLFSGSPAVQRDIGASKIRIRISNLLVRIRFRIRILPSTSKKTKKNLDFYCFGASV
jgi:hypothetical protein